MALNAVEAGFSWSELFRIKYTHLMLVLWEWEDMRGGDTDETVDATPSDVNRLKTL